jgi:hypothetical protein
VEVLTWKLPPGGVPSESAAADRIRVVVFQRRRSARSVPGDRRRELVDGGRVDRKVAAERRRLGVEAAADDVASGERGQVTTKSPFFPRATSSLWFSPGDAFTSASGRRTGT